MQSGSTTYAYITNFNTNSYTYCVVATNGELTDCKNSTPTHVVSGVTEDIFNAPTGIAINDGYAYIVGSAVAQCSIWSDGELSSCARNYNSLFDPSFGNWASLIATYNGYAYIPNGMGNNMVSCALGTGGALANCSSYTPLDASSQAALDYPTAIAIDAANGYAITDIPHQA